MSDKGGEAQGRQRRRGDCPSRAAGALGHSRSRLEHFHPPHRPRPAKELGSVVNGVIPYYVRNGKAAPDASRGNAPPWYRNGPPRRSRARRATPRSRPPRSRTRRSRGGSPRTRRRSSPPRRASAPPSQRRQRRRARRPRRRSRRRPLPPPPPRPRKPRRPPPRSLKARIPTRFPISRRWRPTPPARSRKRARRWRPIWRRAWRARAQTTERARNRRAREIARPGRRILLFRPPPGGRSAERAVDPVRQSLGGDPAPVQRRTRPDDRRARCQRQALRRSRMARESLLRLPQAGLCADDALGRRSHQARRRNRAAYPRQGALLHAAGGGRAVADQFHRHQPRAPARHARRERRERRARPQADGRGYRRPGAARCASASRTPAPSSSASISRRPRAR